MKKGLSDLTWVPLLGDFESTNENEIVFRGREFDSDPTSATLIVGQAQPTTHPERKNVTFGRLLFNEHFSEGEIRVEVEFEAIDSRSLAQIMIQYDSTTTEMINFGIGGSGGPLFALHVWERAQDQLTSAQSAGIPPTTALRSLQAGGTGASLKSRVPYQLKVAVRGSVMSLYLNSVEVGKQAVKPSFFGKQFGLFCGSHSNITFRDLSVQLIRPQAFVVMQFNTPAYEALYKDVISPVCDKAGLRAFRADLTYSPGLVIADITRQISESRVIIAEITPVNGNVYYEIGYADALGKPVILIAESKASPLPFDVRAYRTIFYENTIAGKAQVEKVLEEYLTTIFA